MDSYFFLQKTFFISIRVFFLNIFLVCPIWLPLFPFSFEYWLCNSITYIHLVYGGIRTHDLLDVSLKHQSFDLYWKFNSQQFLLSIWQCCSNYCSQIRIQVKNVWKLTLWNIVIRKEVKFTRKILFMQVQRNFNKKECQKCQQFSNCQNKYLHPWISVICIDCSCSISKDDFKTVIFNCCHVSFVKSKAKMSFSFGKFCNDLGAYLN